MKKIFAIVALVCVGALSSYAQQPAPIVLGQTAPSFALKTTTGAGTAYRLPTNYVSQNKAITWVVNFKTAAPGAETTNLEGSLDNVNWYTLDSSTNISYTSDSQSGEMRHVANKPVIYVRCNLASYTQGSNAGVTCNILAAGN